MDWFKWHALNWSLRFKSWFGGLKREANRDVLGYGSERQEDILNGDSLGFEKTIAGKYFGLGHLALTSIRRMNFYFLVLIVASVTILVRLFQGLGDFRDNYVFLGATGILLLALLFFVYEILRKNNSVELSKEKYENAQEWLKAISEDAHTAMPWWQWFILLLGLGLESYAIGLVIAAAATGGQISSNVAGNVGVLIGAGIAVLLAAVSHAAGSSLNRATKRQEIKSTVRRQQARGNDKASELLTTFDNQDRNFESQYLKEITSFSKYGFLVLALFLSIAIGAAAFYERANLNWESIYAEDVGGVNSSFSAAPAGQSAVDIAADRLSQNELDAEIKNHEMNSIYAALFILFLLLIGMNILGIVFAYNHSLSHKKSKESHKYILKYESVLSSTKNDENAKLSGRQDVIHHANNFFEKYHGILLGAAIEQGEVEVKSILNKRGSYRMGYYLSTCGKNV